VSDNNAAKLLYNQLWLLKTPDTELNNTEKSTLNPTTYPSTINSTLNVIKPVQNNDNTQKEQKNLQVATVAKPLIESWNKLTDLVNNCTLCRLCDRRKNVVIERGNRNSQWMFIGEAPGENEDIEGLPFVGNAGQLLDKMILAMKLDKNNDVYICNTVKCRPPQNRNPEIDEIAACNNYLLSQINLVKPKIIVALGRIAAHTLLNTTIATNKLRNQIHYLQNNIPVIVTYHPAYLLRNPAAKKDAWEDLQLAMKTFANL
jgi:DNA polymerase